MPKDKAGWVLRGGFCRPRVLERKAGAVIAVTSRVLGDMKKNAVLGRALKKLGLRARGWAAGEQVHGKAVRWLARPTAPRRIPSTDAFATKTPGLALCVRIADCAPVFLVDPAARVGAAVHAGWRGADRKILTRAVRLLVKRGARAQRLLAAVGPHIQSCCYEVGPDVARRFPGAAHRKEGAWHLSLAKALAREAQAAGLKPANISAARYCTGHDHRFYSFRREKTKRRQVAIFALIS